MALQENPGPSTGGAGGGLGSMLGGGRGRLGIVGIIIVVLAALWFGVSPKAALDLFNGNSAGTPAAQTTQGGTAPTTQAPAPQQQTAPAQPQQ